MRRWVVTAALALVVTLPSLVAAVSAAETGPAEPVAATPSMGDRGHYVGGEQVRAADGTTNRSLSYTSTWTAQAVPLPNGSELLLPTLVHRFPLPADAGDDDAGDDTRTPRGQADRPPVTDRSPAAWRTTGMLGAPLDAAEEASEVEFHLLELAYHHAELPDRPEGFSIGVLDEQTDGRYWRVFRLHAFVDGWCASQPAGTLSGLPAGEAKEAADRCAEQVPWGTPERIQTQATWTKHPDWGTTWVHRAEITYRMPAGAQANASLMLRTSPAVSMPLEHRMAWTERTPDGLERHTRSVELVGWQAGDGPLPAGDAVDPGPTVPIVPWTGQGPQEAWDPGLSFERARDAIASTPTAEGYHQAHPEANLNMAIHLRRHADERSTPATSAANLGKCENPVLPELEALRGRGPQERGWALFYSGETEDLYGQADRAQPPGLLADRSDRTPAQAQASRFASHGLAPGLELPTKGPSMRSLLDHLPLADRLGARGDAYAAVLPPSGEGLSEAPDRPPLDGAVGRLRCALNPATGAYSYEDTGIVFQEGQAAGTYTLQVEAIRRGGLGLAGLSSPPTGSTGDGTPATELGLAGVAVAATGVLGWAGTRVLGSLYSRISREELLDHPVRARLHEAVHEAPGSKLGELAGTVDRHRSTVAYHLRRLDEEGLIDQVDTPSGAICFPVGHPLAEHGPLLARGQARELLVLLQRSPGRNLTSYADELGVSKGYISRLARQLEEAGLLERRRQGRKLELVAHPRARDLEPVA